MTKMTKDELAKIYEYSPKTFILIQIMMSDKITAEEKREVDDNILGYFEEDDFYNICNKLEKKYPSEFYSKWEIISGKVDKKNDDTAIVSH